jgi:hypothetical protein
MLAAYPKWIPSPTEQKPDRIVKVATPDDHARVNPEHYAAYQAELAEDHTGGRAIFMAQASAQEERERCALIAETFPRGGKIGVAIAAEIRGGPPPKSASVIEPDNPFENKTDFGRPLNAPVEDSEIHPPEPPVPVSSIINKE